MKNLNLKLALTFDDILLVPNYADFLRSEIDLETNLTKKIKLKVPFVSAPMDRVTESKLAISLAKVGGIGIIHRNLSVSEQAKEVQKVKKHDLLVGAAISAGAGYEPRVDALVGAKVDVIVIDSAHGHTSVMIETIKEIKKRWPQLEVIAGNVATYEGAKALIEAGADALRVGMGPGSICSTRIISGMGVPQVTAISETFRAAEPHGVPIIADGGIRYSGDVTKALAVGASTVMMGSFFASAVESPGKVVNLVPEQIPSKFKNIINNREQMYAFKEYRGMGSIGAMEQGAKVRSESEFHGKDYKSKTLVAEGVEGLVPIRGTVAEMVDQMVGGIRSGMFYVGTKNIGELWEKAEFVQITQASLSESHPHDIVVTNPGENYV